MKLLNKYPLSLTSNYVSDWGLWEAVREIIQNALDNKSGHSISYDSNQETLTITSDEVKLEASTLLLGNTSKRDDSSKIGSFGEGYKIACLVLLCRGYAVSINNADVVWEPSFQHSVLFDTDVNTTRDNKRIKVTQFHRSINGVHTRIVMACDPKIQELLGLQWEVFDQQEKIIDNKNRKIDTLLNHNADLRVKREKFENMTTWQCFTRWLDKLMGV